MTKLSSEIETKKNKQTN